VEVGVEVGAAGGVESAQKELGQKLFGEEGEEEGEEEAEEAPAVREEEIKDDEEEMDDFIDYADGEKPRPRAQGVRLPWIPSAPPLASLPGCTPPPPLSLVAEPPV
jgi:hypothetical protein